MARRQVAALVAGGLLALATALVAIPGIASAHNPNASLNCSTNNLPVLTINLTNYNGTAGHHNMVAAAIDGVSVLATTNFAGSYSNTFSAGSPYTSHTAQVVVFAWDDPAGIHGWTTTINLSTGGCQKQSPTPGSSCSTVIPDHVASPTPHRTDVDATQTPGKTDVDATKTPCATPTTVPTASPTQVPTTAPTNTPVVTAPPTSAPTESPTTAPTASPTTAPTESPTTAPTASPTTAPTDTPVPTDTPYQSFQGETATPAVTAPPTTAPTSTPFQSFQGDTATPAATPTDPAVTQTPFESFQGETAPGKSMTPPPTSTGSSGSNTGSTPLFALLICFAFGGLGIGAARMQRRTIRR